MHLEHRDLPDSKSILVLHWTPFLILSGNPFQERILLERDPCVDPESLRRFLKGEWTEWQYLSRMYRPSDEKGKNLHPRKFRKLLLGSVRFDLNSIHVLQRYRESRGIRLALAANAGVWYHWILPEALEEILDYLFLSCEMGVLESETSFYPNIRGSLEKQGIERFYLLDSDPMRRDLAADAGFTLPGTPDKKNLSDHLLEDLP